MSDKVGTKNFENFHKIVKSRPKTFGATPFKSLVRFTVNAKC